MLYLHLVIFSRKSPHPPFLPSILAMNGFNVQKTQPAPADPEAAPPTYEKVTEDERKKLEDVR
jgi:hypothetical protein